MTKARGWYLICVYIALEACLNVSARSFQLFCAWFFLKAHANPGDLALILTCAWVASTAVLPFAGVIADRVPKRWILVSAALASVGAASVALIFSLTVPAAGLESRLAVFVYLACAATLSIAAAAVTPIAIALLPSLGAGPEEVSRGLRLRSSMFVVNLLLGPTLAGAVIGQYGGTAALALQLIASTAALSLAIYFAIAVNGVPPSRPRGSASSVFRDIRWGFQRVLTIPAERVIAIASLFGNLLYVPFLTLLLPAKILGQGLSALDLAVTELSMGWGVLFASTYGIPRLSKLVSQHTLASIGICALGLAMMCFAVVHQLELLCLLAFILGFGISTFNVTVNTRRALSIPDGFRSAMESSLLFVCTLAVPVGLNASKEALLRTTPDAVIAAGASVFCVAILFIVCSSSLRRMLNANEQVPYYQRLYSHLFVR